MSQKANPVLIGAFVVAALTLLVVGTLTFTTANWFGNRETFILYFNMSVRGLDVGAPVKFQGVTVGSVADIRIRHNQPEGDLALPVLIQVDERALQDKTDDAVSFSDPYALQTLIQQGLRAKLEAESLLTGRLYVNLEIDPAANPPHFHSVEPLHPEIPTERNEINELMNNIAKFDLEGIGKKLDAILVHLEDSLSELQVKEISHGLTNLLGALNGLVSSSNVTLTLASVHATLEELRGLSASVRVKVDPLVEQVDRTLAEAETALAEVRRAAETAGDLLAPRALLPNQMSRALQKVSEAAQSVQVLADFLHRNPNALITGRDEGSDPP